MKIKDGYVLKEIAGLYVVITAKKDMDFDGILTLNETGAFLWNELSVDKSKQELLDALLNEFDVSKEKAEEDLEIFLAKLEGLSLIE